MSLELDALVAGHRASLRFVVERAERYIEEAESLRQTLSAIVADHGPFPVPTDERIAEVDAAGELAIRRRGNDPPMLTFDTEAGRAQSMREEFDKTREDGAEPSEATTTIHEPTERR